jgi:hypothetical protein
MFTIGSGSFDLLCVHDALPAMIAKYVNHASLAEQIDLTHSEGTFCFIAVRQQGKDWPSLVVAQRYDPAGNGFYPGALIVEETHRLFVGAGTRLLCYDLSAPSRVWEDSAECGFWFWRRDESEVFMGAELEFAAFDITGRKLWTQFVEPPWDFKLEVDTVVLDVMGSIKRLDRWTGQQLPE